MSALAERVDGALGDLHKDERRALELRERTGADYASIAGELGVRREEVADLLVSARLSVRAHVRDAVAPPHRTPQCGPARRVLAAQQDEEAVGPEDLRRLRDHLDECADCQAARRALLEAGLACRAWRTPGAATAKPAALASPPVVRRRRLIAGAAAAVVALILAVALLTGGDDDTRAPAAPVTQQGSADAPGQDVVPAPGDRFCLDEDPDCK